MIRTENLTKYFGSTCAVDNLNLEVKEGEIYCFLGPNAAGKTTTIKLLVGLLRPTQGRVFIGGYDVQKDYVEAKKLIGYIPDLPYLYEKLTGWEFMEFIVDLYHLAKEKARELSQEHFKRFRIWEFRDHLIEDYSHGMRQKLAFAACFLHEPRLIIVDEPMVGLDPYSAKLIKEMLKEKATQEKVTVFLSTHTLSLAEEIADRIGIIDKARLVAEGTFVHLSQDAGIKGRLEEVFLKITEEEVNK
jgi:ABC-2 type transport system ATP-binding protein